MNKIWAGMIVIAIVLSIIKGNLPDLIGVLMESTRKCFRNSTEHARDDMHVVGLYENSRKIRNSKKYL